MSKSRFRWNQFGNLTTAVELEEYLQREYEHGGYYHYTSLENIDKILASKTFWISNVQGFNDKAEIELFGEKQKNCYATCFSTGRNENLPLWYMYSGIDGKGGRIRLTKDKIRKMVCHGKYYLSTNKTDLNLLDLTGGNSIITFKDIVYFEKENEEKKNNHIDLKYNTMTNYGNVSTKEFEKYKKKNIGFYKYLIWYYEKETRLLVELKGEALDYIKKHPIKDKEERYVVKLSFGELEDVAKAIRIDLGPEITDVKTAVQDYQTINEYIFKTSNVSLSKYSGQVEMKLSRK